MFTDENTLRLGAIVKNLRWNEKCTFKVSFKIEFGMDL